MTPSPAPILAAFNDYVDTVVASAGARINWHLLLPALADSRWPLYGLLEIAGRLVALERYSELLSALIDEARSEAADAPPNSPSEAYYTRLLRDLQRDYQAATQAQELNTEIIADKLNALGDAITFDAQPARDRPGVEKAT